MSSRWRQGLAVVPSIGFSMLPKLACPACWPVYAGLLTSIGLGFLISVKYLLPLTAAFLVLALGGDALQSKEPPWIWSLCACNIRGERRSARQVCLGFPARGVRRNRTVGYRFALEYAASTGKC